MIKKNLNIFNFLYILYFDDLFTNNEKSSLSVFDKIAWNELIPNASKDLHFSYIQQSTWCFNIALLQTKPILNFNLQYTSNKIRGLGLMTFWCLLVWFIKSFILKDRGRELSTTIGSYCPIHTYLEWPGQPTL